MTTWWQDHNELGLSPFSVEAVGLLDEVEAAYQAKRPPSWPGRGYDADPREDEYSSCADPEKFRMVLDRCLAWTEVLTARGWANADHESMDGPDWLITLHPVRDGALPIILRGAEWVFRNGNATMVVISAGDPPVGQGVHPDCGCDACDWGSAELIRLLDEEIFSVVDGSLVMKVAGKRLEAWTSFGGGSRDRRGLPECHQVARPWGEGWQARAVQQPSPELMAMRREHQ